MDDNKKLNQPNTATPNNDDYQKILDEYAASIKPEEDVNDVASPAEDTVKLETVKEDNLSLKDINSLQLEAPDNKSISANTLKTEPSLNTQPLNIEPPILDQSPKNTETKLNIEPPIVTQPTETLPPESQTTETKTPEEIKAQIDKIFADDSSSSNDFSSTSFSPSKTKSFAKNFFFLSIAIFFLVAAGWIYFLYFYQQPTTKTVVNTVSPTPTKVVSQETCELNGTTYKVGESFKSADGCNTCSCQTANTIACTEMACNISPVVTPVATKSASTKVTITPTKSATTSSIPKDWKTYTNSTYKFSINYPSDWIVKVSESGVIISNLEYTKGYSDPTNNNIDLGENVSISFYKNYKTSLTNGETLETYISKKINFPSANKTTINKLSGYKVTENGMAGIYPGYYLISGNDLYVISSNIGDFSETEKQIINTIKFN